MPAFLIWQFYWRELPRGIGGVSVLFISLLQSYKMQKTKKGIDNKLCKEYNDRHRVHVYANKKCIYKNPDYK